MCLCERVLPLSSSLCVCYVSWPFFSVHSIHSTFVDSAPFFNLSKSIMSFSDSDDGGHQDTARPTTPPATFVEPYTAFTTIPRAAPGTPCCGISTLLHNPNGHTTLLVTSAIKVADGLTAGAFVAYTIKVGVSTSLSNLRVPTPPKFSFAYSA